MLICFTSGFSAEYYYEYRLSDCVFQCFTSHGYLRFSLEVYIIIITSNDFDSSRVYLIKPREPKRLWTLADDENIVIILEDASRF